MVDIDKEEKNLLSNFFLSLKNKANAKKKKKKKKKKKMIMMKKNKKNKKKTPKKKTKIKDEGKK